ncbi:MAG TPA: bifunctional adenosylcobinamide kinase/adenosylcobinamide-phosphate guanylyltransferase [Thermodesulfatator atlanticus]|uniref:Adenosylcobinamide kinase n=1 Tax=Thermodesulfatator atlanticus TaxID=501497 RepID=A0A7V5NXZ2_9BACT|nr:bifunctional adenosylcobinamide kinase/adenosylcobinamide-phosphate guanylyltransferase [Thermodesulfatator atlanticus]
MKHQGSKILVLGGIKSGKSRFALALGEKFPPPRVFMATAEPFNEEMARKIEAHRRERGPGWQTVESPVDLPQKLKSLSSVGVCLIDCLTVWLGNLIYYQKNVDEYFLEFSKALEKTSFPVIMVSNEVGLSPVSADHQTRFFVEKLGVLNQEIARHCDQIYLLIAGKTLKLV